MPKNFTYGPRALKVPGWAEDYIDSYLEGVSDSAVLSSAFRDPENQARIMFDNLKSKGIPAQRKLYNAATGGKVIDVYESMYQDTSDTEVKAAMTAKVREVVPNNCSHHCSKDPTADNFVNGDIITVDIEPSTLGSNQAKFIANVNAAMNRGEVYRFHQPPNDPAFHIEFTVSASHDNEEDINPVGSTLLMLVPWTIGLGGLGYLFRRFMNKRRR